MRNDYPPDVRQGGAPATFVFRVRNPEARWVKNNLLEGMRAEDRSDRIRVEVTTTSLGRLARFVVGTSLHSTQRRSHASNAVKWTPRMATLSRGSRNGSA